MTNIENWEEFYPPRMNSPVQPRDANIQHPPASCLLLLFLLIFLALGNCCFLLASHVDCWWSVGGVDNGKKVSLQRKSQQMESKRGWQPKQTDPAADGRWTLLAEGTTGMWQSAKPRQIGCGTGGGCGCAPEDVVASKSLRKCIGNGAGSGEDGSCSGRKQIQSWQRQGSQR